MPRHDDEERETRGRPTGPLLLRFAYGAGLIALGACLGIVIGSLTETLDTMAITMRIGDARKIRKDYAAILGAAEPIPDRRRA